MKRLALALPLLVAMHLHAQGCSQCTDNMQQAPPQVQRAYRHAIYLMGGAGALFLLGSYAAMRRFR